ncbi:MAG: dephospho-CoA kinase [Bacteroidales bacterium]|nr:dephospho-CoA kinase [Bacteroidales bacterium]
MLKIGLTGGIGTGKSFVSKILMENGIPVFDADTEVKKLYDNPDVLAKIRQSFGENVFYKDKLNFAVFAQVIFSSENSRKQIAELIHPFVLKAFNDWAEQQNSSIVVMESALVFENNLTQWFDKIVVVDAPEMIRIARIKKRNPSWSEDDIKARMKAQMAQEEKCKLADLVIYNEGSENLTEQVLKIKMLQ